MEKLIKRILELTQSRYAITLEPGPYPRTINMTVRKNDHKIKEICSLDTIDRDKTAYDMLLYALETSVWRLYEAKKGE